jgi:hypothetical protein
MSENQQPAVEIIAPTGQAGQAEDNRSASAKLLERYQKRFQPGESGNPGGRPKLKLLSRAAREQLAEVNPETGLTGAEEIVVAMMKEAKKGNIWAAKELREWTEGRVPNVFIGDVNHTDNSDMSKIKTLLMSKLIRQHELPAANEGESKQ